MKRRLTVGEVVLVHQLFGNLDVSKIRIVNGRANKKQKGNQAKYSIMSKKIFFAPRVYSDDFSKSGDRGLFIHEMTHVWQDQTKNMVLEYIKIMVRKAMTFGRYDPYKPPTGGYEAADFYRLGIEQQANYMQHYVSKGLAKSPII